MRKNFHLLNLCSVLAVLIACNQTGLKTGPEKKFLDLASMDSAVRPGDNFYLYVNGKWIKNAVIPPTQSDVGGFTDLFYKTQDVLHQLLDSLSNLPYLSF